MAANPQTPFTNFDAFILIAFLVLCAASVISPKVREHKKEVEQARQETLRKRREYEPTAVALMQATAPVSLMAERTA